MQRLLHLDIDGCDSQQCVFKEGLIKLSGAFFIDQSDPVDILGFEATKYRGNFFTPLHFSENFCDFLEPNCPFKGGELVKFNFEMEYTQTQDPFLFQVSIENKAKKLKYCGETHVTQP